MKFNADAQAIVVLLDARGLVFAEMVAGRRGAQDAWRKLTRVLAYLINKRASEWEPRRDA